MKSPRATLVTKSSPKTPEEERIAREKMEASDFQKRRLSNFKIEVTDQRFPVFPGEKLLHFTHNGYQWSTVALSPREIRILWSMLQKMIEDGEC
jgi:hypothetical protein